MRRAAAVLACALLFAATGAAAAPGARDYDPASHAWNGLGLFVDTAAEAHVALTVRDELDWATVAPDDVLVFVYPHRPLSPRPLRRFVEDGGRVVVFDDFGGSAPALAPWGIHRVNAPAGAPENLDGNEAFPVWRPRGQHFLFFNIAGRRRIVANHPAAWSLSGAARAVLRWPGTPYALVAEVRDDHFGGAILAVADASLLIDEMMLEHGNKQFAANCLRYFCRREPCRATLVLPWARIHGAYRPRHGVFLDAAAIGKAIRDLNAALGRPAPERDPFHGRLLGLVLLAGGLVLAGLPLTTRLPRPPLPRPRDGGAR